jgi:hypothetical protein
VHVRAIRDNGIESMQRALSGDRTVYGLTLTTVFLIVRARNENKTFRRPINFNLRDGWARYEPDSDQGDVAMADLATDWQGLCLDESIAAAMDDIVLAEAGWCCNVPMYLIVAYNVSKQYTIVYQERLKSSHVPLDRWTPCSNQPNMSSLATISIKHRGGRLALILKQEQASKCESIREYDDDCCADDCLLMQ